MFEHLSERLGEIFRRLGRHGKLTPKDLEEALREVRLALLEADVNFKVVKDFTTRVNERALGAEVLESLTPAQQIIKIVNEELVGILGPTPGPLTGAPHPPSVVMLVGLQGSGKTTTAAKLALSLKKSGHRPMLVAADNRRPAAIEQLVALATPLGIPVYRETPESRPQDICARALSQARKEEVSWAVVDTAGRMQIDEALMTELEEVKKILVPNEILLVADAMTGQEAVRIAGEFHQRLGLTGLILTKMDGDARGGASLSIRWATGVPIRYIGTGEKPDALEVFQPERLASRILGMGDMLSLIEKAEEAFSREQAEELEKKVKSARFGLDDFLVQMRQMKKMGPLNQLLEMIPGMSGTTKKLPDSEKELKKVEAIILSMTTEERRSPNIIDGSRRRRIARGSGTTPQDINQLLNRFKQMQKLLKMTAGGKMPRNLGQFYSR
jgi:signal recognition particle subunit SRP54